MSVFRVESALPLGGFLRRAICPIYAPLGFRLTSFCPCLASQLELQQRSAEFLQLLDPSTERLRPEMLSRIPPLDEATLKVRWSHS
jgi:hypothetical protein